MSLLLRLLFQATSYRGGDGTPGGASDAFLQEDGIFGFLLEDGTSYLMME